MDGFPFLASFSVANSEEREGGGSRARKMKDKEKEKEGRWGGCWHIPRITYRTILNKIKIKE